MKPNGNSSRKYPETKSCQCMQPLWYMTNLVHLQDLVYKHTV